MRLQEILAMLRENLILALVSTVILGLVFYICYRLIYRRILGGNKQFTKKQLLVITLFSVYIITVFALTFLSRGANYYGGTNLSLFSSYREAWHNFSLRDWQYIYFNILMFVPFGFLLPLLHAHFEKVRWTATLAILFTFIIETIQYITGLGIFELDDLFNNVLGAMIGFGLIQSFKSIKRKNAWHGFMYLSPLLIVVILSGVMFTYYYTKDYGNLSIVPVTKMKMKDVTVSSTIALNDDEPTASVYKAPVLSKAEAEKFAYNLFEKLQLETTNIEIIAYQNEANYRYYGETSYFIWLNFLDSTYNFTDFSSHDEGVSLAKSDENSLRKELERFGITIPEQAQFKQLEVGHYEWIVDQLIMGEQLIDGTLTVNYYNDDTVKSFNQQIVAYDKVQDIQLKSEQEAFEEILEGSFNYYTENDKIQQIQIEQVKIEYELDSKGFYQPVYEFTCLIDGEELFILIPGIK